MEKAPKLENSAVVTIIAPVNLVCRDIIGQRANPFESEGIIYFPNCGDYYDLGFSFTSTIKESDIDSFVVNENSYVGFTSEKQVGTYIYNSLLSEKDSFLNSLYRALVLTQYQKDNQKTDHHTTVKILAENNNTLLMLVHDYKLSNELEGSFNYYRLDISTETSSFITKHNQVYYINEYGSRIYTYDNWENYPDIFAEFLPDTWAALNDDAMERITKKQVREKYGLDTNDWISYTEIAQNDSYVLIAIRTDALEETNNCAWYKADKYKTLVSFVKEGPYQYDPDYVIAEHLWFKEYPDLANEFPSIREDIDKSTLPYLNGTPYTISIDEYDDYRYSTRSEPEGGDWEEYLSSGTYTIIKEQYDDNYSLWGELESGEGWVCISNIRF